MALTLSNKLMIYYLGVFSKIEKKQPLDIGETSARFSKSFFMVLFLEFFLYMLFLGSFRGVKTYSEKKDLWVRTFKHQV